jgi:putative oxygen-independent coproporphyrinogen III oxidase
MAIIPASFLDEVTGTSAARFGVYVHFPYCLSKCPYCDFASVVSREIPQRSYARAVTAEMDLRLSQAPLLAARTVDSIFFGGGTPSLWEPSCIELVLEAVRRRFDCNPAAEITLEANPGAADASRFQGFRQVGVNRLSIGVQSFEKSTLRALGREHDGESAARAFALARAAGFRNISMDFIYGVHGQTLDQVISDARRAVVMKPEHLSAYALTLERETLAEEVPLGRQLERGEISLPADEVIVDMARAIRETYAADRFIRYEISNYALPGFHSRHNSLYWTGGEYLGLGVGAAGHARSPTPFRYSNHRSPERYLRDVKELKLPEAWREALGNRELFEERLAMGLRLSSGIDLDAVCAEFGEPIAKRREEIGRLIAGGFARRRGRRVALTERGANLHSSVCARLI